MWIVPELNNEPIMLLKLPIVFLNSALNQAYYAQQFKLCLAGV